MYCQIHVDVILTLRMSILQYNMASYFICNFYNHFPKGTFLKNVFSVILKQIVIHILYTIQLVLGSATNFTFEHLKFKKKTES